MKFNPNTIYVLQYGDGATRIFCEKSRTSLLYNAMYDKDFVNSTHYPTKESFEYLIKLGYQIIQEWK